MKNIFALFIGLALTILLSHCAGDGIFQAAPTDTSATGTFPNPIALQYSDGLGKLYVVNSDGEVSYTTGSFAAIDVDVTDPNAPVLTTDAMVSIEQFGAELVIDANFAYITNRKSSEEGSKRDHVVKLRIDDGSLDLADEVEVGPNPFGIALSAGELFVASDRELNRFSADPFGDVLTVLLSDLDDVSTKRVQGVAVDAVNGWVFVTNRGDDLLVIDLDDVSGDAATAVDYRVEGLDNTRGIVYANGLLYVLEGSPPSIRTLNPALLSKQAATELIDDSALGGATAAVGNDPGALAVDVLNDRVYVTNTGDDTVSVFDLDLTPIATISVDKKNIADGLADGDEPFGITAATVGAVPLVFVANYASDTISVINATTLKVVATFPN